MTKSDLGLYSEAEALHREILLKNRRILHQFHPDIFTNEANLALAIADQKRYGETASMLRDTLKRCTDSLGDEHKQTFSIRRSLAEVLTDEGNWEEAKPLSSETFEKAKEILGVADPETRNCATVLENCQIFLRECSKAITLKDRRAFMATYWEQKKSINEADEADDEMDTSSTSTEDLYSA